MKESDVDVGKNSLSSDPRLRRLVSLLMAYQPEKILLFGSHTRGQADEFSDYDIVVIKRTQSSFLERLQEMVPLGIPPHPPAAHHPGRWDSFQDGRAVYPAC